jgi:exodeoxyribonuclease VII small subunit
MSVSASLQLCGSSSDLDGMTFQFQFAMVRAAVAAPSAEPGFDAILVRLREVVQKLESGELSLEQSLAVYEEGVQLARKGQQLLASAEKRVEILVSASGGVETAPFTSTSDDANGT